MFRFISAPPSTARHRQLLRLRSNLTVYSSLSSHPASPRPCLHVSNTLLSLHLYTDRLQYLETPTVNLHAACVRTVWNSRPHCSVAVMAPLAVVSCMLPYFPTSPGVILWPYGAVQTYAGLGFTANANQDIHKKQRSVDTQCLLWS